MDNPALGPLTPREQRVANFFRRPIVAESLFILAAGSAAYTYCDDVVHAYSWPALIVLAVAGAWGVRWLARRRTHPRAIALAVVFLAVFAGEVWLTIKTPYQGGG